MRIVAGNLKSRTVEAVKGMETRPTQDHIKESIFNRIGPYFEGGKMLDLFAGSGNISFESISRGIDEAYMIDKSYAAIQTIKKNASNLKVVSQCHISKMDYMQALKLFKQEAKSFDLIYVDPPYALPAYEAILTFIGESELVNEGGKVVVESGKEESLLEQYGVLEKVHEKVYGITKVTIYRR